MRTVCSECGSEIPEGADFCYKCGARLDHALKIDDEGAGIYSNRCFNCGGDISPGDQHCAHCGRPVSDSYIPLKAVRPSRMGMLAMLVAFFGGLVDVFGLGHLVLKKWSRGIAFIVISAVLFYLSPAFLKTESGTFILLAIRLLLFLFQFWDVLKIANGRSA